MKIHIISDTHGHHQQFIPPKGIDMLIHCGDASNARDKGTNALEMGDFFNWFEQLDVKYKLFSPGNHDTSVASGFWDKMDQGSFKMVIHNTIQIEGINIFMSPYTPDFGTGWAYNIKREKINRYWEDIPENTDILITHGPPKGILDISENRNYELEYCGCSALLKRIEVIKPKYSAYGHIHDFKIHRNYGTRTLGELPTTFINAAMVEDGKFGAGLIHNGITIEI